MKKSIRYLKHLDVIKIACLDILEHTENRSFEEFVAAKAQRLATNLNLLIIG